MKKNIAIIGAGISGLTLGQKLKEHAHVTIFEKARGVGGRMSTRYADPFYFDHGAPYFTARTDEFQSFLQPFIEDGLVAEWSGKVIDLELGKKATKRLWFEPHWVATPNMNSVCKQLGQGLDVRLSCEVAPLTRKQSDFWELQDKQGASLGAYDWVISTAPLAQTQTLFHTETPLHGAPMRGCYSLMIGFNRPWDKQWIAAKVRNNPIEWIIINSTKPQRNKDVTSILVHSSNHWADEHSDCDMQEAQKLLVEQFMALTAIDVADADYLSTHRWKYAVIEDREEDMCFYLDAVQGIAATSDWASGSRIEEVWLSAKRLAEHILAI